LHETMIHMRNTLSTYLPLFLLCFLTSCLVKDDPKPTYSELMVARGDLVVTSFTNDSLVVFSSNGTFKKVLYQLPNAVSDSISTISWLPETNEILMAIEGTPDRVDAFSVVTGNVRNFYINTTYLTGTILGITQLKNSSDILVSEGTTVERFSSNGTRETWTTIWPSNVHANNQQLVGLSTGRWLSCSSTVGVRIYPDSTTAMAVVSSVTGAIAATTASFGCGELSDGRIVVAWNGTNDALQVYSATLTGVQTMFANNPAVLADPRGLAIGENDEIYVTDGTRNVVVEIDPATNEKVREFGNQYLQSPRSILIIPDFN
jgi:hypothetical protein